MIHDPDLLEALATFPHEPFSGTTFRATRKSLDPLAFSTNGGRWAPRGESSILYTSRSREAALAEIIFYWSKLDPLPSKPVVLNQLKVKVEKTLRLRPVDFARVGIDETTYHEKHERCQEIGAVTMFLGFGGLIAPSARCNDENFMVFGDNIGVDAVELLDSEEVEWRDWARQRNLLD